MSLKLIARDLYQCKKEIEQLERSLESARPEKKASLEEALRRAKADCAQMQRVLDGHIGR
ncbi:MAG: hypothetical protein P8X55_19805 [Desulfosarcinaceae bacterium]